MVERIRQILQTRQLSPTQFADALGLARPIISHVLSGRNKPSLEVVQKIIAAFPDISLPWLLSGQGPMLASAAFQPPVGPVPASTLNAETPASPIATAAPQRPKRSTSRASEAASPAGTASPVAQPVAAPVAPGMAPPVVAPVPPGSTTSAPIGQAAQSASPVVEAQPVLAPAAPVSNSQIAPQEPSPAAPDMLAAFAEPGKTIRRIVIFYHDGTFSAYQPEIPS